MNSREPTLAFSGFEKHTHTRTHTRKIPLAVSISEGSEPSTRSRWKDQGGINIALQAGRVTPPTASQSHFVVQLRATQRPSFSRPSGPFLCKVVNGGDGTIRFTHHTSVALCFLPGSASAALILQLTLVHNASLRRLIIMSINSRICRWSICCETFLVAHH